MAENKLLSILFGRNKNDNNKASSGSAGAGSAASVKPAVQTQSKPAATTGITTYNSGKRATATDKGITQEELNQQYSIAKKAGVNKQDFLKQIANGTRWKEESLSSKPQYRVTTYNSGKRATATDKGITQEELNTQYAIAKSAGVSKQDFLQQIANGTRWKQEALMETTQNTLTQDNIEPTFMEKFRGSIADSRLGDLYFDHRMRKLTERYGDKTFDDDFWGQLHANYATGMLGQEIAIANSDYMDNPTEENRQYLEEMRQLYDRVYANNITALDDYNVKAEWITKHLGQYFPQLAKQTLRSLPYMALGTWAGGGAGFKVGASIGSGLYSYDTMRGSAFMTLTDLGIDEKVAKEAANDEAIISALIESGDTLLDLSGISGAISGLTGVGKESIKKAMPKLLDALKKYAGNIGQEYSEEFVQQMLSAANIRRIQNGDTSGGPLGLIREIISLAGDMITGNAKDIVAEAHEAGKGGAIIGAFMGGVRGITTGTINELTISTTAKKLESMVEKQENLSGYSDQELKNYYAAANNERINNPKAAKHIQTELEKREAARKAKAEAENARYAAEAAADADPEEAMPLGYDATQPETAAQPATVQQANEQNTEVGGDTAFAAEQQEAQTAQQTAQDVDTAVENNIRKRNFEAIRDEELLSYYERHQSDTANPFMAEVENEMYERGIVPGSGATVANTGETAYDIFMQQITRSGDNTATGGTTNERENERGSGDVRGDEGVHSQYPGERDAGGEEGTAGEAVRGVPDQSGDAGAERPGVQNSGRRKRGRKAGKRYYEKGSRVNGRRVDAVDTEDGVVQSVSLNDERFWLPPGTGIIRPESYSAMEKALYAILEMIGIAEIYFTHGDITLDNGMVASGLFFANEDNMPCVIVSTDADIADPLYNADNVAKHEVIHAFLWLVRRLDNIYGDVNNWMEQVILDVIGDTHLIDQAKQAISEDYTAPEVTEELFCQLLSGGRIGDLDMSVYRQRFLRNRGVLNLIRSAVEAIHGESNATDAKLDSIYAWFRGAADNNTEVTDGEQEEKPGLGGLLPLYGRIQADSRMDSDGERNSGQPGENLRRGRSGDRSELGSAGASEKRPARHFDGRRTDGSSSENQKGAGTRLKAKALGAPNNSGRRLRQGFDFPSPPFKKSDKNIGAPKPLGKNFEVQRVRRSDGSEYDTMRLRGNPTWYSVAGEGRVLPDYDLPSKIKKGVRAIKTAFGITDIVAVSGKLYSNYSNSLDGGLALSFDDSGCSILWSIKSPTNLLHETGHRAVGLLLFGSEDTRAFVSDVMTHADYQAEYEHTAKLSTYSKRAEASASAYIKRHFGETWAEDPRSHPKYAEAHRAYLDAVIHEEMFCNLISGGCYTKGMNSKYQKAAISNPLFRTIVSNAVFENAMRGGMDGLDLLNTYYVSKFSKLNQETQERLVDENVDAVLAFYNEMAVEMEAEAKKKSSGKAMAAPKKAAAEPKRSDTEIRAEKWETAKKTFGRGHRSVTAGAKRVKDFKFPGKDTSKTGIKIHRAWTEFANAAVQLNDGYTDVHGVRKAFDGLKDTLFWHKDIADMLQEACDLYDENSDTVDNSAALAELAANALKFAAVRAKRVAQSTEFLGQFAKDAKAMSTKTKTGKAVNAMLRWQLNSPTMFKYISGFVKGSSGYEMADRINNSVKEYMKLYVEANRAFDKVKSMDGYEQLLKNKFTVRVDALDTDLPILDAIYLYRALHSVKAHRGSMGSVNGILVGDKRLDFGDNVKSPDAAAFQLHKAFKASPYADLIFAYDAAVSESFGGIGKKAERVLLKTQGFAPTFYNERYYAPLHWSNGKTVQDFNNAEDMLKADPRYTKARTRTDGGYIAVRPMSEVVDGYIRHMSDFVAYKELREDLGIMNLNAGERTTKTLAEIAGGEDNTQLAKWMNNWVDTVTKRTQKGDTLFGSLRQNFQKAVLIGAPSVIIKQPASYWSAAGVISMKSLMLASPKMFRGKNGGKGTAAFDYRSMTGEIDPSLTEILRSHDTDNAIQKAFSNSLPMRLFKNGISMAEQRTIGNLYHAAAYDILAENPGIDKNSDKFKQMVDDLFTEAIITTQSMYQSELRPENARTDNELIRLLSMFRSQQAQDFSRFVTAVGEYTVNKTAANKQQLRQTMAGHAMAALTFAALGAVSDLLLHKHGKYRDEEDEEFSGEKFAEEITLNAIQTLAGVSWFGDYVAQYVIDTLSGGETNEFYGVSLGPLTTITDALESLQMVVDQPTLTNAKRAATYVSQLCGVPLNGAYTLVNTFVMFALDASGENKKKYDDVLKMLDNEAIGAEWKSDKVNANVLVNAALAGNTRKENLLWEILKDDGKSAISQAVKNRYVKGDISREQTNDLLIKYVSQDAEENADTLESWQYTKDTGRNYSELKSDYLNGDVSREDAAYAMTTYGGKTAEEAEERIRLYDFIQENPRLSDATVSFVRKYESVKDYGFDAEQYYGYWKDFNAFSSIDSDGDGNTDISKQSQVTKYIQSLPLSKTQKDILWESFGYKTTTAAFRSRPWR